MSDEGDVEGAVCRLPAQQVGDGLQGAVVGSQRHLEDVAHQRVDVDVREWLRHIAPLERRSVSDEERMHVLKTVVVAVVTAWNKSRLVGSRSLQHLLSVS